MREKRQLLLLCTADYYPKAFVPSASWCVATIERGGSRSGSRIEGVGGSHHEQLNAFHVLQAERGQRVKAVLCQPLLLLVWIERPDGPALSNQFVDWRAMGRRVSPVWV